MPHCVPDDAPEQAASSRLPGEKAAKEKAQAQKEREREAFKAYEAQQKGSFDRKLAKQKMAEEAGKLESQQRSVGNEPADSAPSTLEMRLSSPVAVAFSPLPPCAVTPALPAAAPTQPPTRRPSSQETGSDPRHALRAAQGEIGVLRQLVIVSGLEAATTREKLRKAEIELSRERASRESLQRDTAQGGFDDVADGVAQGGFEQLRVETRHQEQVTAMRRRHEHELARAQAAFASAQKGLIANRESELSRLLAEREAELAVTQQRLYEEVARLSNISEKARETPALPLENGYNSRYNSINSRYASRGGHSSRMERGDSKHRPRRRSLENANGEGDSKRYDRSQPGSWPPRPSESGRAGK